MSTDPRPKQGLIDGGTEALGAAPVAPGVRAPADDPSQARKATGARLSAGHAYRLVGPPGCGKTTALATVWVPKAVERFGPEAVVVCSLTKSAAHEIASRNLSIPRESVGTLHSLALRSLGRPKIAQDDALIAEWNAECAPLHRLSCGSATVDNVKTERVDGAKGDKLMELCEQHRHRLTPRSHWPSKATGFFDKWEAWKHEHEVVDFTDLIEMAVDQSHHAPGDPAVLLVDEAQDLSSLEMGLVKHWGARCEFFVLAGDGDQSIYGWRGADAEAFLSTEVPDDHVYPLTQSYRVPRAVQAYAARWIDKVSKRYPSEYKPKDEPGECRIDRGMSMRKLPRMIREVEADLARGESVMLLATCSYMINSLIKELRTKGIAFHNPYRLKNGRWNPMRGGVERLVSFLGPMRRELQEDDDAGVRFWSWAELARWVEPLRADSFARRAKGVVKGRKDSDRLGQPLIRAELRSVFTDEQFVELGEALAHDDAGPALRWFETRLLPSQRSLFAYALKMAKRHGLATLRHAPRLVVGTVHSVKGGGADNVYLSPDVSGSAAKEYSRRGAQRDGIVRTFYVGMTRAVRKLVLLGPSQDNAVRWLPVKQENAE